MCKEKTVEEFLLFSGKEKAPDLNAREREYIRLYLLCAAFSLRLNAVPTAE